jgi:23S rRNA (guanosine2251-2'-O)-methyltransferase
MRTYEHLPFGVNLKTHEKLPLAPISLWARRELAVIPSLNVIIGTIMNQRKQKSGKPGNRPGRDSQQADRKGKSSPIRNLAKSQESRRDNAGGAAPHARTKAADEMQNWRPERGSVRPKSPRGHATPDGYRDRPDQRAEPRPDRRPDHRGAGGARGGADEAYNPNERSRDKPGGPYWLFGQHPVTEAIGNPLRKIQRLVRVGGAEGELPDTRSTERPLPPWEPIERHQLEQLLPEGAVHQGIAARVSPLPELDLLDIAEQAAGRENAVVVILDQVTDPHNVGAILRSAAAFGALAVILTERHAAPESGTLAKSASGALEHVPLVRVGNLARAMEQLKEAGFWLAGLAAEGKTSLAGAKLGGKVGLVMGAEGSGLRRLTRDHCDLLVRLPTGGAINHLNVSNAAAVALYELARGREG